MTQWEYLTLTFTAGGVNITSDGVEHPTTWGHEGWELVNVLPCPSQPGYNDFYFKRQVPDSAEQRPQEEIQYSGSDVQTLRALFYRMDVATLAQLNLDVRQWDDGVAREILSALALHVKYNLDDDDQTAYIELLSGAQEPEVTLKETLAILPASQVLEIARMIGPLSASESDRQYNAIIEYMDDNYGRPTRDALQEALDNPPAQEPTITDLCKLMSGENVARLARTVEAMSRAAKSPVYGALRDYLEDNYSRDFIMESLSTPLIEARELLQMLPRSTVFDIGYWANDQRSWDAVVDFVRENYNPTTQEAFFNQVDSPRHSVITLKDTMDHMSPATLARMNHDAAEVNEVFATGIADAVTEFVRDCLSSTDQAAYQRQLRGIQDQFAMPDLLGCLSYNNVADIARQLHGRWDATSKALMESINRYVRETYTDELGEKYSEYLNELTPPFFDRLLFPLFSPETLARMFYELDGIVCTGKSKRIAATIGQYINGNTVSSERRERYYDAYRQCYLPAIISPQDRIVSFALVPPRLQPETLALVRKDLTGFSGHLADSLVAVVDNYVNGDDITDERRERFLAGPEPTAKEALPYFTPGHLAQYVLDLEADAGRPMTDRLYKVTMGFLDQFKIGSMFGKEFLKEYQRIEQERDQVW